MTIRLRHHGPILRHLPLAVLFAAAASPSARAQHLPTPESVLGHTVGEDFYLATFEESLAYFEALASASDRVELVEVGRTSFGRPAYIALISSAENLRNVERYREISQARSTVPGGDDQWRE